MDDAQSDLDAPAHAGEEGSWHPGPVDWHYLGVAVVPLFPALIIPSKLIEEGVDPATQPGLFGLAWLVAALDALYLIAWVASRVRGERRFGFFAERVWLPAVDWRLRGIWVRYDQIRDASCGGTADRYLTIRFDGGSRKYRPSNPRGLEKKLTARLPERS